VQSVDVSVASKAQTFESFVDFFIRQQGDIADELS
jgi:hypothetical protein